MSEHKIFGQDIYWANFIGLMVLTAIEVVAVGSEFSKAMTLFILSLACFSQKLPGTSTAYS